MGKAKQRKTAQEKISAAKEEFSARLNDIPENVSRLSLGKKIELLQSLQKPLQSSNVNMSIQTAHEKNVLPKGYLAAVKTLSADIDQSKAANATQNELIRAIAGRKPQKGNTSPAERLFDGIIDKHEQSIDLSFDFTITKHQRNTLLLFMEKVKDAKEIYFKNPNEATRNQFLTTINTLFEKLHEKGSPISADSSAGKLVTKIKNNIAGILEEVGKTSSAAVQPDKTPSKPVQPGAHGIFGKSEVKPVEAPVADKQNSEAPSSGGRS